MKIAFLQVTYYDFIMKNTPNRLGTVSCEHSAKRIEILRERFEFMKASFEIEGIHFTQDELHVLEDCIKRGCSFAELNSQLEERFPYYAQSV